MTVETPSDDAARAALYDTIAAELASNPAPPADRTAAMERVLDALWNAFNPDGDPGGKLSWIGFYLMDTDNPEQLTLGPSRGGPACSPIGLHGACGKAFIQRAPVVVRDVNDLGDAYIACDPRDRSEVVVPITDPDGTCHAVLDADSHELAAFTETDAAGLLRVCAAAQI